MTPDEPLYPQIEVEVPLAMHGGVGLLSRIKAAMRKGGCTEEQINAFAEEAMKSDLDHFHKTCAKTVRLK